jgi:putative ABC transport system permease protein
MDVFTLANTSLPQGIDSTLPAGLVMEGSSDRRKAAASLSAAFRLNLSALSLLALLVSLYLILQALDAAVVRRRSEIAILRSLGVTPQSIRRAWFVEALTLGVAGSLAGVLLGIGLARISVQAVTQTLGNLYVQGATRGALWSWSEVTAAFVLGIGASLVAGWLPARDAALTPPAQALGRSARALPIQLLDHPRYGLLALVMGAICYPLPPLLLDGGQVRFPLFGYLSATFLAVGLSILACTLLPLAAQVLMRIWPHDARVRYATSQLRKPSGRHKLAMAGLLIATAMAGGITLLVHSFQGTVSGWLGEQLRAEVFVSARGFQHAGSTARIPFHLREALLQDPAIADREWSLLQRIPFQGQSTILAGIAIPNEPSERIWLTRPEEGLQVIYAPGDRVSLLASEPFVRKFGLGLGDDLTFDTPAGPINGRIKGVFADYANEHGTLVTSAERMVAWFGEDRSATLGLYLKPGSDRQGVVERMQIAYPSLNIRDQTSLRQEVFEIFQQTFSVTSALKGIGVAVAVAGLVLSQLSQFTERRGELRVLKELGFTRKDIALAGAGESTVLVLVGSLTGLVAALLLGHILIYVINRQSFGWTLQFAIPWASYFEYFVLILVAGSLTGALTGAWASRFKMEKEE